MEEPFPLRQKVILLHRISLPIPKEKTQEMEELFLLRLVARSIHKTSLLLPLPTLKKVTQGMEEPFLLKPVA